MLKTFLVKSVLVTLFFGAATAGATAAREITARVEPAHQLVIQREQVQAAVSNELQNQTAEHLRLGPEITVTGTTNPDYNAIEQQDRDRLREQDRIRLAQSSQGCDATQQQDRDRLQDQDQDRTHQSEVTGVQDPGNIQMNNGSCRSNGNGGQP